MSEPRETEDFVRRLTAAARQEQFLSVATQDEAHAAFRAAVPHAALSAETVPLADALGRVLAQDVASPIDVPPFDRALVDGFAVRAADAEGAGAARPRRLALNREILACGVSPSLSVAPGTATPIATGGVIPRGADAVVMVEHTELDEAALAIDLSAPVRPGQFVGYAGADMALGETVLRKGLPITAREIGMLAACGLAAVPVVRRPSIAILSTGDELVAPGATLPPGSIYDSNGAIVAASVTENGGEPAPFGIVRDDEAALERALREAISGHDLVVLSGGTSKGAGDVSHRILDRLGAPGILVHGVALKPGKPLCLAVAAGTPVVVLPGFPTSAMFTFHEFVVPLIRALAGLPPREETAVAARVPQRVPSELGRTEFVMASLGRGPDGPVALPLPKGSGSVTAFSQADGFFAIPAPRSGLEAGEAVSLVRLVRACGRRTSPSSGAIVSDSTGSWGCWPTEAIGPVPSGSGRPAASRLCGAGSAIWRPCICSIPRRASTTRRCSMPGCGSLPAGGACRAWCSGPAMAASRAVRPQMASLPPSRTPMP